MKVVIDASVALKWYLAFRPNEQHLAEAMAVANAVHVAGAELFAPSHWTLEILAVLAREAPKLVDEAIAELDDMRPKLVANAAVLKRGAELAIELDHHLFDTLYHAVALEVGGTLVTADERYFEKANALGSIVRLQDFAIGWQPSP